MGCQKKFARFRTKRDPKRPAVVRKACHVERPAGFQAGAPGELRSDKRGDILEGPVGSPAEIPGDNQVDSRAEILGDNQLDTPAVVHAGQTAGHIEDQVADPFLDQPPRWRALRLDCLGRGEPRCSMDMPVVVAMLAEVRMAGGNLRGLTRRPSSVLENR